MLATEGVTDSPYLISMAEAVRNRLIESLIESQSESFRSPHLRTLKMRETKRSRATWSLT